MRIAETKAHKTSAVVKVAYTVGGESFSMLLDLVYDSDRERLIKTSYWAALNDIQISQTPMNQASNINRIAS